ncbi:MAG: LamG-like jellyroll fold domain-containing protein [Chitinophagales bacterium]|nr:LamG-like jellyroll fold domain-containing protein [Chitinophagales bacterium]
MRYLFVVLLFIASICLKAQQDGDTTMVQTFTFGSPQNAWFQFPPAQQYQKVLMLYTLKCNPAQNPACGEWDYLTYANLYKHLGIYDSTLLQQPSYIYDGGTPDSVRFMTDTSYRYESRVERFVVYNDTLSLNTATLGTGTTSTPQTLNTAMADGKAQYLWTAAELQAAGLTAGNITGLVLNVLSAGSDANDLIIRLKHSSKTELLDTSYETTGFTTVYEARKMVAIGWQSFAFTAPFNWDGTSNLVVEIVFDNRGTGVASTVAADSAGGNMGIYANETDYFLQFQGGDFVEVPAGAFAAIDSAITISFWSYGDPAAQPQNNSIFEGYNANGQRVLNVHLPWGDSNIYWDAGNNSGFDRIQKVAPTSAFEGKWNHWAFTKDARTGVMRIYLNGTLFNSGSNKRMAMDGVVNFKIGAFATGRDFFYDGLVNEFQIWNKALDQNTIKAWMFKDVDPSHPDYAFLQAYYPFNEGSGTYTVDASGHNHTAALVGLPEWQTILQGDNIRNIKNTQLRPQMLLEQGVFDAYIDSVVVVDTIANPQISIIRYTDAANPTTASDTIYAWPTYYNSYVYNAAGQAIDSSAVSPDSVLYLSQLPYYSTPFEITETIELGRYITPYGINLDLGPGFTWVFDVSDYAPLLHDSVHLSAGNWQELLDMKFMFIHGTPPRNVIKVENVWTGDYGLNTFDQTVLPKTIALDPLASTFRLKTRASGHGWDNATNCAEFCPKLHTVLVNGVPVKNWELWKDCGHIPLFPQGGTWLIDRAAWCPGEPVNTYDHEITPYILQGATQVQLDYDAESDPFGNYVFHAQFISYDEPNFVLDAAVTDIIKPTDQQIYGRFNPSCDNPVIVIKNTGATNLTQLDISYGVDGGRDCYYTWTGNLSFLETDTVALPPFDWTGTTDSTRTFHVNVDFPNAAADGYLFNNDIKSQFLPLPKYDSVIIVSFRSNLAGAENSWEVRNEYDSVVASKTGFANNTQYNDTVRLQPGCYSFTLYDTDEDGISFFANNDGNGSIRLRRPNNTNIITLEPDFGEKLTHYFMVGHQLGEGPAKDTCTKPVRIIDTTTAIGPSSDELDRVYVYPNPTGDICYIRLDNQQPLDATITVTNSLGMTLEEVSVREALKDLIELRLGKYPAGIYYINVSTAKGMQVKKLVLSK